MGLKDSNEITVKVICSFEELCGILERNGLEKTRIFTMDDYYMIPNDLDTENMTIREIIAKAVLVRGIEEEGNPEKKPMLTFKRKEFNSSGDIISQEATNCKVENVEDAINFMKAINYKPLMNIKEYDEVYRKGNLEVATKQVKDGDLLIEIETEPNTEYDTIEKLKKAINELGIPIEPNEFFIKKAEIQLKKMLEK